MALLDGLSLDATLKALAAIVALTFALIVLVVGRGRLSNAYLAGFLLLIAGNQAAETMRAVAADEIARVTWFRLATVFAAMDPVALALALNKLRREPILRMRSIIALLGLSTAFALVAVAWIPIDGPEGGIGTLRVDAWQHLYSVVLSLYTAAVYLGLLVAIFTKPRPAHASDPLVVAALAIAGLPPLTALTSSPSISAFMSRDRIPGLTIEVIGGIVLMALSSLILVQLVRRSQTFGGSRRIAIGWIIGAAILSVLLNVDAAARLLSALSTGQETESFAILGRSGAPIRWFLFCALMSVVVLRFDEHPTSLRARRNAARILITLGILVAFGATLALMQTITGAGAAEIRPIEALVLAFVVLASQSYRSLIDLVAARVYGVPPAVGRLPQEESDAPLKVGDLVSGRYRVERFVGRGGAGNVFLAQDEVVRRKVVLKEMFLGRGREEDDLREARIAGAVAHPNVVAIFDVLRGARRTILVQEYVEGGTLHDLLGSASRLPPERAAELVEGILAGLSRVHEAGIVHGDIKPANVLLTADFQPKLADFGIARFRSGETIDMGDAGIFQGTPEYAAPEQMGGARASPRADVYSAALVAKRLFGDEPPAALANVLRKALDREPTARFENATVMAAAWRDAAARIYARSQ